MRLDIQQEVAMMRQMTGRQLRAKYEELLGEEPRSGHKDHLVRRITWRIQALAEGDLSERASQRAAELARDADLRLGAPRTPRRNASERPSTAAGNGSASARDGRLPMPGTILVRQYLGQTLQVTVLEQGLEYDGRIYKSLTAVAKRITGKHWNGFHFFGLSKKGPIA
jgi:hypothetical protein